MRVPTQKELQYGDLAKVHAMSDFKLSRTAPPSSKGDGALEVGAFPTIPSVGLARATRSEGGTLAVPPSCRRRRRRTRIYWRNTRTCARWTRKRTRSERRGWTRSERRGRTRSFGRSARSRILAHPRVPISVSHQSDGCFVYRRFSNNLAGPPSLVWFIVDTFVVTARRSLRWLI